MFSKTLSDKCVIAIRRSRGRNGTRVTSASWCSRICLVLTTRSHSLWLISLHHSKSSLPSGNMWCWLHIAYSVSSNSTRRAVNPIDSMHYCITSRFLDFTLSYSSNLPFLQPFVANCNCHDIDFLLSRSFVQTYAYILDLHSHKKGFIPTLKKLYVQIVPLLFEPLYPIRLSNNLCWPFLRIFWVNFGQILMCWLIRVCSLVWHSLAAELLKISTCAFFGSFFLTTSSLSPSLLSSVPGYFSE